MSQVKVVELKIEGKGNTNLPLVVQTLRQQTKKQLSELLQNLFNNTDDALFELADRSDSDKLQELYFDGMRMIRLHRKTLTSNFMLNFQNSFSNGFSAVSEVADDEQDYTLLDQDELEMSVAVSGIVSKVTSQYSLAIMQLTKRLDALAKSQSTTERTNPLGPYALSTIFADTLNGLDVDIKIRIILMKLFERFVMERLGPIYESANHILIKADVLPDLKNKSVRTSGYQPANGSPPKQQVLQDISLTKPTAGLSDLKTPSSSVRFNLVQSLLAGIRSPYAEGMPEDSVGSDNVIMLPTLDSNELVQTLNTIQHLAVENKFDIDRVPDLADIRSLVLSQPETDKKSLGKADDDTVNFIGMLFDYILNDRNLAIPMKALIGRLQIPIVKLAIIDKSFFEKRGHPARALLNELSSAGIGWSSAQELKRDALYNKIESIVLRVLDEFSDNSDIFSILLNELRAFVSKDSRRSVLVEQRVKESEVGKAKTHDAKLQVQNLVNQKACGLRLPSEAGRFISEVWSRVLTLRMVKHGESSSLWSAGVTTLDNLLWSLQPLSDLSDINERDNSASNLLSDIREGMAEVGCPLDEVEQFLSWLTGHMSDLSENDRAYLEEDERPEMNVNQELIEEIVLTPPIPVLAEQSIDPQYAEKIKTITEGTWVEIQAEQERTMRCKLATVTRPGNSYVFVNRRGMKVLEQSQAQLVEMFKQDSLKLIDESQVFDRALQSVIGNLRQMQRDCVQ